MKIGTEYFYYQNDHLGTPQMLTDQSGAIVWSADYESFGKASISIAAVENNLRFPGQYYDRETGLHYNWHRYYDPEVGRYLQIDPIGFGGGINLFVYTANNPIIWFDPFGLHYLIDPFTGGYKPHRHNDSTTDPFPGPGLLDPESPDHNDWRPCIKCNDIALRNCLGNTSSDVAGCAGCYFLPPGPKKVAACAGCAAGSAKAAMCVLDNCQSGRENPCTGECE